MSDRDEFGAFLLGFIIGGLTGAMAAILLAPQSGEETRTVIKEHAIELRERAGASMEETYAQAEAAAAEARARFEELAELTRQRAEVLQQQSQHLVDTQKDKLNEVVSSFRKPDAAA